LNGEGHNNGNMCIDGDFIIKLTYLCDIFEKLNSLNTSLQGKETYILKLYDKIVDFIKKIDLRKRKLTEKNVFLNDLELPMSSITILSKHLMTLKTHFMKYFPEEIKQ